MPSAPFFDPMPNMTGFTAMPSTAKIIRAPKPGRCDWGWAGAIHFPDHPGIRSHYLRGSAFRGP